MALAVPWLVGARLPAFTNAAAFVVIFVSLALVINHSGQVSLGHGALLRGRGRGALPRGRGGRRPVALDGGEIVFTGPPAQLPPELAAITGGV